MLGARTKKELQILIESNELLNVELSAEEVLSISGDDMSIQDSIAFIKKYGHILKQKSVSSDRLVDILLGEDV